MYLVQCVQYPFDIKFRRVFKAARSDVSIGAGLFSSRSEDKMMRQSDDSQACIRSTLERRRIFGLTPDAAKAILGEAAP